MRLLKDLGRWAILIETGSRFYYYWALVSVLVFGLAGYFLIGKIIPQKWALLAEMSAVTKNLVFKETQLKDASDVLNSVNPYKFYIDSYIPDKLSIEAYMVDVVAAAGSGGYYVRRFVPLDRATQDYAEIQVDMEGYGDVSELIQKVEDLKRLAQVNNVTYMVSKDTQHVSLVIKVFTIK